MLFEYLKYLRNPGNPFARTLGYSKELVAIEARYKRNKNQWQSHIEHSQEAIMRACEACSSKSAVMILGAGLFYDIPIEYLSKRFSHVQLIDVVFSAQAKRIKKKFNNIQLVVHDLNGIESQLNNKNHLESLPRINATLPQISPKADLIVSANILSQLHLAPIHYLERIAHVSDGHLIEYAQRIIQAHIHLLKQQKTQVCLITDFYRFARNKKGEVEQEHALLGSELPEPDAVWQWDLAPKGELTGGKTMKTQVHAYYNFS